MVVPPVAMFRGSTSQLRVIAARFCVQFGSCKDQSSNPDQFRVQLVVVGRRIFAAFSAVMLPIKRESCWHEDKCRTPSVSLPLAWVSRGVQTSGQQAAAVMHQTIYSLALHAIEGPVPQCTEPLM